MAKKRRISTHEIETKSKNVIRSIIDNDGNGLFRDLTGTDYGIDAIVEVFDSGCITGEFVLIQCKGQENKIEPLSTQPNFVSCSGISAANIDYVEQDNSLVILIMASVEESDNFYYSDLRDLITDEMKERIDKGQKKITVRIPVANNAKTNMAGFWDLINDFYSRRKTSTEE